MKKDNPKNKANNGMAERYEAAWYKLFYALPEWRRQSVIEDPSGRHASELSHEAALLAEDFQNKFEPFYSGQAI